MESADIRRVRTDTLEIGYEEHGRPDAPVVMLLHGFPDDARAWDEVAPAAHRRRLPRDRSVPPGLRPHALPRSGARPRRPSRRRWARTWSI